jgi:GNAT superfamily N-acetyltransferase
MTIKINQYQPIYKDAIIAHILNIQLNEFQVPITAEDQPDLQIIPQFYQVSGGNFWVATIDGQLVGTIALIPFGTKNGCIRKMFVHKDFRGKEYGIARLLLTTLLNWSRVQGISALYLGTIERLKAAIRFYEKNGFTRIEKKKLPDGFPLMAVDTHFYVFILK